MFCFLQNLRRRIGVAGYNTVIYTGTFGVTQLRDASGRFIDIYLESNNRLPVPLYFYKVITTDYYKILNIFLY